MAAIVFLLVSASLTGEWLMASQWRDHVKDYVYLVDLDEEYNIPTYFSVTLTVFAGALFTAIATRAAHRDVSKWLSLAVGFCGMAYDKLFMVHERLILPIRNLLGGVHLGIFYYAWVVPGTTLVGL